MNAAPRATATRHLVALIASVVAAHDARAQSGDVATAAPDIVVVGTGLALPPGTPAYGSTTIPRERLTNDASGRIEDVLSDVAGFQQFRRSDSRSANPSAQGVTLRALGGNASSRTLVLLDAVPIADPFFGAIPFTALVPERLGGVRVTRGGGSGAFGSGAVAGTIELVSAGRRDLPVLAASVFDGSRNAHEVTAALSPGIDGGFATLSGRFERGDGFQTTPADQRVAATVPARYRDWSGSLRAVIPTGADGEVQVHGLLFDDHRTLRFAGADSHGSGADASIRFVARGRWQIDALGYLQARDFGNAVVSASTFAVTLDQRKTPSTGVGGKLEIRPPLAPQHVARFGIDDRRTTGELLELAYDRVGAVTTQRRAGGGVNDFGAFVDDDWTIGHVVLTGGARIDRWTIAGGFLRENDRAGRPVTANAYPDRYGTEWTGRGGAVYRVAGWASLRAAAYTSYRLPTLNELYRPFVIFPVTTQANPALAPEKLRGVEGGLDLHPFGGSLLAVTVFYNRLDDAVANLAIAPNLRRRGNVDAIVAKGVEVAADWRRGALDLSGTYAFDDSRVVQPGAAFDRLRPAESPSHSASATLAWTPRAGGLLSATARYAGARFEDDLQTDLLPGAWTLDAVARLPLARGLALIARAENLLDATVETRNQGGSIDLGAPRTLWIGVRLR